MRKLLAALVSVPLLTLCALAGGGTYTVTLNSTNIVVPPVVSTPAYMNITNWVPNHAYAVSDVAKLNGQVHVVQVAGTSAATLSSTNSSPRTDGTVTWIKCPTTRRGFAVQWSSGGTARLTINGGPFDVSSTGTQAVSLGGYDGAVTALGVGSTVVINVVEF